MHYVYERVLRLLRQRKGRRVRAGEAARWTRDYFHALGLHRLRGTIRTHGLKGGLTLVPSLSTGSQ